VPSVRGLTLATARTALQAAHCAVGATTSRFSSRVAKGRVISQSAAPGTHLSNGAAVNLVLSKGRAPVKKVTLCYKHRTVHVTKAVAKKLRKHGAKLGACRKPKKH
jgi:beta-lactam-binding protein with PASTA domain